MGEIFEYMLTMIKLIKQLRRNHDTIFPKMFPHYEIIDQWSFMSKYNNGMWLFS